MARASGTSRRSTVPRSRSASSQPLPVSRWLVSSTSSPQTLGLTYSRDPAYQTRAVTFVLYVVVAQRDVAPLVRRQLRESKQRAAVLGTAPIEGKDALDLPVQDEHAVLRVAFRPERRTCAHPSRPGGARRAPTGRAPERPAAVPRPSRRRRPAPRTAAGSNPVSAGPRRVVIAGDQHDGAPPAAPPGAAGTGGTRRRWRRWSGGRSGTGRRRRPPRPGAPRSRHRPPGGRRARRRPRAD